MRANTIANTDVWFWPNTEWQGDHLIWIAGRYLSGYGMTRFGKIRVAHRVAFVLKHGIDSLSDDEDVLHKCDIKPCVNWKCLYKGTALDNAADAANRNRLNPARGITHWNSVLTDEIVEEIRAFGSKDSIALAEIYGVSPRYIRHILAGTRR